MSSESKKNKKKNQKRLILGLIVALVLAIGIAVGLGVAYLTTRGSFGASASTSPEEEVLDSSLESLAEPAEPANSPQGTGAAAQAPAAQAPAAQAPAAQAPAAQAPAAQAPAAQAPAAPAPAAPAPAAPAPAPAEQCPVGILSAGINEAVADTVHGEFADFADLRASWELRNSSNTTSIKLAANSSWFEISLLNAQGGKVSSGQNVNSSEVVIPPGGSKMIAIGHGVFTMNQWNQTSSLGIIASGIKPKWVGSDCAVPLSTFTSSWPKPRLF